MRGTDPQLLSKFEAFSVDPASFGHREHVAAAFGMLQKYSFLEATTRYAMAVDTIATQAGAANKFNVTITFAFLSLIAERMHARPTSDVDDFLEDNPDLSSSSVLGQWYSKDELATDFARTHFLMPSSGRT